MQPTTDSTTENVKNLRTDIDSIVKGLELLGTNDNAGMARTHLRLAKAFLGGFLGSSGVPNPYPVANTSSEIPPEVDVSKSLMFNMAYLDDLQWVNVARRCIKESQARVMKIRVVPDLNYEQSLNLRQCYAEMAKAGYHLGFLLGELRDSAQAE